jgi:hypothetical protein
MQVRKTPSGDEDHHDAVLARRRDSRPDFSIEDAMVADASS